MRNLNIMGGESNFSQKKQDRENSRLENLVKNIVSIIQIFSQVLSDHDGPRDLRTVCKQVEKKLGILATQSEDITKTAYQDSPGIFALDHSNNVHLYFDFETGKFQIMARDTETNILDTIHKMAQQKMGADYDKYIEHTEQK